MVMTQVRRYLEDNYMFDLSLDSVGEILHISPAYLSANSKIPKDELLGLPDGAADQRGQGAAGRSVPFLGGGGLHGSYEDASYFARAFKKRTGMTPPRPAAGGKKSAEAHL